MEAYYNALAQQDAQLATEADQAGMDRIRFGTGLMGSGAGLYDLYNRGVASSLNPYEAYLRGATGLETLGQQPLEMGSALGGRNINTTGANALYGGGMGAASTMGAANAFNPFADFLAGSSRNREFTDAISKLFSGGSAQPSAGNLAGSSFAYDAYGRPVPII
jgi:hypothetical protein